MLLSQFLQVKMASIRHKVIKVREGQVDIKARWMMVWIYRRKYIHEKKMLTVQLTHQLDISYDMLFAGKFAIIEYQTAIATLGSKS